VTGAVRLRARTRIQVSVEVSLAQTDVDAATGDAATRVWQTINQGVAFTGRMYQPAGRQRG
jgi:hypothetical protein